MLYRNIFFLFGFLPLYLDANKPDYSSQVKEYKKDLTLRKKRKTKEENKPHFQNCLLEFRVNVMNEPAKKKSMKEVISTQYINPLDPFDTPGTNVFFIGNNNSESNSMPSCKIIPSKKPTTSGRNKSKNANKAIQQAIALQTIIPTKNSQDTITIEPIFEDLNIPFEELFADSISNHTDVF